MGLDVKGYDIASCEVLRTSLLWLVISVDSPHRCLRSRLPAAAASSPLSSACGIGFGSFNLW